MKSRVVLLAAAWLYATCAQAQNAPPDKNVLAFSNGGVVVEWSDEYSSG
ncbi:MAG TPA: hypothetical protein VEG08_11760 [Terriglobales bacterium]|nr:hypothetical protein [Terriglobales bacterium]